MVISSDWLSGWVSGRRPKADLSGHLPDDQFSAAMLIRPVSALGTSSMAAQGKHSPFTFKAMACWAGIFLVAWAAIKLLDTHLDLRLLADSTSWPQRFSDWLSLETPMPNWSLLMIIAILISTLSAAIYYARNTDGDYDELHEIERKVYKMNNPQFPRLTDNQTLLMEALAYHANFRKVANLNSICKLVSLSTSEVEADLKQLQDKRLIKQKVTRGTFGATTFELTLAGKDYALERFQLT
ncbi:hypothetical protein PMI32_04963 [Pseudomonas sp. GM60]|nr:hypothetical protein PMI32_04963 [Pseudomonas sp. GM60]